MKKLYGVTILFLLLLMSCVTSINDLKRNPSKYSDQIVTIKGEITKLIKIPFTDYSFFEIKDNTDNILVFTLSEHKLGSQVSIKCKVIAFDAQDEKKSTILVIKNIEDFLINNIKLDEDKLKKNSKLIGETLSKALNVIEATYFLIEQNN